MRRTIAIGDIHGKVIPLQSLINWINPTKDDTIVFLGDYVDRGESSKDVIQTIIDLKEQTNVIAIRGNHEEMMLQGLQLFDLNSVDYHSNGGYNDELIQQFAKHNQWWFRHGGEQTIESYDGEYANIPDSHREFLNSTLDYHETSNHIFTHANIDILKPNLAENDNQWLRWTRCHDGYPGKDWRHITNRTVFVGHTPQRQTKRPLFYRGMTCIDTGCGYSGGYSGGVLTAINCDSNQYIQADYTGKILQDYIKL